MNGHWQEAAVNARLAMRATQAAALDTLRAAKADNSLEDGGRLALAAVALREVTRLAAALQGHLPPRRPSAVVQVDGSGRVVRVSVEGR